MEHLEDIKYYATRLEFIRELYKSHEQELLNNNLKSIRALVADYKKFNAHQDYDSVLASFPEVMLE